MSKVKRHLVCLGIALIPVYAIVLFFLFKIPVSDSYFYRLFQFAQPAGNILLLGAMVVVYVLIYFAQKEGLNPSTKRLIFVGGSLLSLVYAFLFSYFVYSSLLFSRLFESIAVYWWYR